MTIKSLDGLRGLAVLLVLLSHMSLEQINLLPFLDFSGMGKAGVYLFFSLSAFLLTWQALEAGAATIKYPKYWFGYLVRRFLRIYPLYVIALVTSLVVTSYAAGYSPKIESANDLLMHLVLLKGTSIYWAIPVEFTYYLLLPVVVFVLFLSNKWHPLAPGIITVVAIAGCREIWPANEAAANSIHLGPYLAIFLLGSLTASFCTHQQLKAYQDTSHGVAVLGYLALIISLLTIPSLWRALIDSEATNRVFHKEFLLYGVIWAATILAAMKANRSFTAMFESQIFRFLGRVSFSIYLWHYLIVQLVARDIAINSSLQFLLVLAITIPLSWASYRLIERPFINWGHKTTNHWNKSEPAS